MERNTYSQNSRLKEFPATHMKNLIDTDRTLLKPVLGAYTILQTALLYMKRLNKAESLIFILFLCPFLAHVSYAQDELL